MWDSKAMGSAGGNCAAIMEENRLFLKSFLCQSTGNVNGIHRTPFSVPCVPEGCVVQQGGGEGHCTAWCPSVAFLMGCWHSISSPLCPALPQLPTALEPGGSISTALSSSRPLPFGGSTSPSLFFQPKAKNERQQHQAGWAEPRITPSSCLLPTASPLCAHLNFPDAFSSLIKHFHQLSLLAGSDFFFSL